MERAWNEILARFGQEVTLRGEETVSTRAIIQPFLDRNEDQAAPTPLGLERQERLRYMGPARHPLGPDTVVEWMERQFRVKAAHLVGEGICPYWWALLEPREEGRL